MRTNRRSLLSAAASVAGSLALTAVWGCGRRSTSREDAGAAAAEAAAQRVVSVSPNTTETLFALGAGSLMVGRSRYCDYPPEATGLPVVGGFADPSFEAILGLRPSLVVGDRGPAGPELEQRLQAHHIDTYFPPITSVAEVHAMIDGVGGRVDRTARAAALNARLRGDIRTIAQQAAHAVSLRALLVFDVNPIVVAGPEGYAAELLALAGAQNVITGGGMYPMVGIEHLLALDPDVVLDASATGSAPPGGGDGARSVLAERAGWSYLRAVRGGRVGVIRSSAALRPGPRLADGLAEVVRELRAGPPSSDAAPTGSALPGGESDVRG